MCLVPLCSNSPPNRKYVFLAAGQEDGVKERGDGVGGDCENPGRGGGLGGVGLWKPRQGCHSAGQSPALHMSSSSTHNSTTQWDKRWRVGRSARTHTLPCTPLYYPPFSPSPSSSATLFTSAPLYPPLHHHRPTCILKQAMWRLTGLLSCLKQQQKERGVIEALLNSSKDVGAHTPRVYLDHKGGWREGK